MSSFRIAYFLRERTTREAETVALATVYRFILSCHEKRRPPKAAPTTRKDL